MSEYQQMYTKLFNAISDAIILLQQAQQHTEEMFISCEESVPTLLPLLGAEEKEDSDQ